MQRHEAGVVVQQEQDGRTKQDKTGSGVEVEGQWPYERCDSVALCRAGWYLPLGASGSRWAAANRSAGRPAGIPAITGVHDWMCRGGW